jgi:hypothetical protein
MLPKSFNPSKHALYTTQHDNRLYLLLTIEAYAA